MIPGKQRYLQYVYINFVISSSVRGYVKRVG